ncbi:MAG: hypothetical protein IJ306_08745 [Oscillospiraceae bacterium]|nr:hypothetical protein [Oscillospiraceae bacterium]
MRKNRMMRAASALLVAVLLTTSTISGTLAKYVTKDSASDTARVAKWGVELQVEGNLFADSYIDAISKSDVDASLAVNASNDDDVVAPGTYNNEGLTFSIKGAPEVSGQIRIDRLEVQNIYLAAGSYGLMVKVSNVVNEENFDELGDLYKWDTDKYVEVDTFETGVQYFTLEDVVTLADVYYPVKFNLNGGVQYLSASDGTNVDTLTKVADTIAAAINGSAVAGTKDIYSGITTYSVANTAKFDPNTDLATKFKLDLERITWGWAFEGQNDEADTVLGNLMVNPNIVVKASGTDYVLLADEDYCLNLKFDLEMTVEQIDGVANP